MYELPLTSIIQGDDHWNMHSIRFGVTVAYAFVQESDMSLPDIENPPLNIPKIAIRGATKLQAPVNTSLTSLLQAPMKSVLYDSSGNILDNSIAVQKKVSRTMFSIINYVFFDSNSAVIPDRYHRIEKGTNDKYGVDQIKNDSTLGAYYEVLNVIGKRIKDRPGTNVTLIGTNSNSGSESQNLALSKSRAESVRDYFRDIWGIDEEKIKIEAKNLPDQPSKINTDYGDEENRRVEIITDNPEIFLPLKFIDTSSFTIVSDIKFATDRLDKNNLTRWQLRATIGNKVYTLQEGTTTIDDTLKVGVQRYVRDLENNDKVLYKVVSIDNDGLERILAETMVPVKQIISSKNRVEKYNLITFGYNSSNVNETNNFIIEDIKGNINDNSTLTIKGYTDQTGTAAYNRQLSLRRAEEISHYFQSNKIITKGVGFDEILYPLQFPEGRFYSRTVNIMVDTIEDSN
jgi:outer membrane protein OmpA-like peptidoglycan-associated protein